MYEKPVDKVRVDPIKLELFVNGNSMTFKVDTGASVSVCSEEFYNSHFQICKLEPSELTLSSYTNQPIMPIGKIKVIVTYQGTHVNVLHLYVIKNGLHPLMGRDWLSPINVDISFKTNVLYVSKCNNELNQSKHFEKQVNCLLVKMREKSEIHFQYIFTDVNVLCEEADISIEVPRPASRQTHRDNYPSNDPPTYYRNSVFISVFFQRQET
jgi:hypothetical protein